MNKSEIISELVRIVSKIKDVEITDYEKKLDTPLTSIYWKMDHFDMVYFLAAVCGKYGLKPDKNDICGYKLLSLNDYAEYICNHC